VHLVGFIIRIYHDARSSECQKSFEMCVTIDQSAQHRIPIILNFSEHCCKNLISQDLEPRQMGILDLCCLIALYLKKKVGRHELQVSYYVITGLKMLKFLGENL
jgi:hypothetical protein